ncbi:MAG TPA: exodeoxyribonuclease III, partial [Gammaproteobacteria bacterium]|nr:exodeoxyribonuclease III [Gammaproteobacteria bacterium]
VIGLQETKVQDDLFPVEAVKELGYHVYFHGQKAHYGVAMLSKQPPAAVIKGYPSDDENDQRRMITADFSLANGETLRVLNGYFPQGESRDHPVKFP